ncbi:MAG: ABC transporter ATP-binding protein [Mycoplasmatales bacterium]
MIKVKNGTKRFGEVAILDSYDLEVKSQEFLMLYGPSGCGKTTLLNIISGVDKLTTGSLTFNDTIIDSEEKRRVLRSQIGIIVQDFALLNHLSVAENVLLALDKVTPESKKRLNELLIGFNLKAHAKKKVSVLSGGEKQRVAIMRSLIKNPKLLVADEPTGSLDKKNSLILMELLKVLNEKGITIVMVSHDQLLQSYASRIIELN